MLFLFAMVATLFVVNPLEAQSAADSAAIRDASLDYIEGWYTGDGDRMTRALHPALAKRIVRGSRVDNMDAEELIGMVRNGGGKGTPPELRRQDVKILDVYGNSASVRVDAAQWVDYLHLGRIDGRWVIVNVLWEMRPRDG
jgi:hypothetical protein